MRIPQIQGLRALAALLVVVFHAKFLPGGFIGVDIFYVISGYLITGLILREINETGKLNLGKFYQRRIKRLLPTSVFVLFVTAIVGFFVLPPITRDVLGRDIFAAATYSSNYFFAWWQNDYQNLNATPSPFIHYWSLAVEEQFYLIWPIFILFLSRIGKRAIFLGIASSTTISLLWSVYQTQSSPIWAFYSLPTRAWELGIGALILFTRKSVWNNRFIPWLGAFGIGVSIFTFNETTEFPGINALLPVLATALLIGSISSWPRFFNDISNNQLSQWLGAISYPLYLWHWPVLVLPSSALERELGITERIGCILATIVLAHFTSQFIEQPLRHKNIPGKKVYLFFVSTTLLSLIVGVIISATSVSTITVRGTDFSFDLVEVVEKPAIYSDGCHVNYGETKSGKCTYGDLGSKTTIVLYGDSHAAQWFPALEILAKERKFKLISLTKSACSSVDVARANQGAYRNAECDRWRANSVARIQKLKPTAVIISSYQQFAPPGRYSNENKWWKDGQRRLLSSLKGSTLNLIYISDTPNPRKDIPNCLASKNPQSCNTAEPTPNKIIPGFEQIDPTQWLCSSKCFSIKDGYVVYRDASHISVKAALALTGKLEAALESKGIFS